MMTLRKETISMIETAPDEYIEKIFEFVKNLISKPKVDSEELKKQKLFAKLDKLFDKMPPMTEEQKIRAHKRAEIFEQSCAEFRAIIGDDIPWANEEEMIKDLAEMRRRSMRNENFD